MKPWLVVALVSASLAGCATPPPDPNYPVVSQDVNGVLVEQVPRAPRASVGIGLGTWGGRGFGGVGIGLGF